MKEHHQQSIHNLVRFLQDDPHILAILIVGSVAKSTARVDSDIDAYLVVSDLEFQRRKAQHNLSYFNGDVCNYPSGFIDGKIINYDFLEAAARQGSEPTRASFVGAMIAFSRIPGLEAVLEQIPVFPEANRQQNLVDFYAQALVYGEYFAIKAIEQNNPYLLSQSLSQLVLFAGRAILAYNRVLFPCHKSFMRAVGDAPAKPENFMQKVSELLAHPTTERISGFTQLISDFQDWGITYSQAVSIFIANNEWNWMEGAPPMQDR